MMKESTVKGYKRAVALALCVLLFGSLVSCFAVGNAHAKRGSTRQWEDLSPQERNILMERYERYRNLPEYQKELMRKRYEQWKNLSPSEREQIRRYLDEWDSLSPEQREAIRRKLKQKF
ncbi:DUF3106 domain-containing protein [Thermodesulforhabdus norvegica]|uniref:DUF3106 domain-containing protein n=1 Tax=Thermodesulforhabdus norvegica TaxID=39841 RepID=A0A1I4V1Y9_9BACT|nr:DUF3106 domain-containing protein [Thermodesulforhabdus norvegica]SFM95208.1 Protein of unknown function [Thermodesulforhabdus norvegica]